MVVLLLIAGIPLLLRERGLPEPQPARRGEAPPAASSERGLAFSALVRKAVDGDTLVLAGGERVRLLGIDCPEHDSPLFAAAREACREIAEGRKVRIEATSIPPRDHYGRLLALVHAGDVLLNEELVARGLAWVYRKGPGEMPPDVERRLIGAQNRALDHRAGLWSRPGALSTAPGESLVATRYRFHRSSCTSISGDQAPRPAPRPTTREAALRSGRSPCRNCKPRVPLRHGLPPLRGPRRRPCNPSPAVPG